MSESVRFVDNTRGERLAYSYVAGNSPTVVFLSGYASDMQGSKAEFLDDFCRTRGQAYLRFDYSGHGQSEGNFVEGSIGDWTNDAITVLDHIGAEQHVLVGSSMGGWIMLLLALARRNRVQAMLGIASAPDFTNDLMWRALNDLQRHVLETHGQVVLPSEYTDNPYPITKRLIEEGKAHCLLDSPIPLTCPTRLIHGLADRDVPWQTSLRLAESLDSHDVQLQLIKDGEHRLSRPSDLMVVQSTLEALLDL